MSTEKISVTYDGVDINYIERSNTWNFELRGRERHADSLKSAKEAIDKPEPKQKIPFTRIPAWMVTGAFSGHKSTQFVRVEITSIAETEGYGGILDFWIVSDGDRAKEPNTRLIADTVKNFETMRVYDSKFIEREVLSKELQALLSGMERVKITK